MMSCSKGTSNFLPEADRQEVVAIFQGQNPAIEQFLGAAQLAAEVVDQEDAAVGLDVQRGLVEVGGRRCSAGRACPGSIRRR